MATAPQLLSLPRHSRVPYTSPYAYRSLRVASAPQPLSIYRSLSIHTAASLSIPQPLSIYRSLHVPCTAASLSIPQLLSLIRQLEDLIANLAATSPDAFHASLRLVVRSLLTTPTPS